MKFEFEYFTYTVYLGCITICCINNLCDINAEPYNIALGKPTDQGPATYCTRSNGCCTSELAVDGKLGQDPNKRECSHTKKNGTIQGSWWSVNFRELYFLASIRILRRYNGDTDCCKNRMRGLSINGMTGNQEIFRDSSPTLFYGQDVVSITVPASLEETRFSGINISIPGSMLTLCEVQVYLGRSCGNNLPSIPNGNWISADTTDNCYFYGCSYTVKCETGYVISHTVTTTCSDTGSWTTPVETCRVRSCSRSLPNMPNGYWMPRYTNGDCYHYTCSFTLSCAAGYTPNRTTPVTTFCNSNGEWSTPTGYCQVRSCSRSLPNMPNGYWMPRYTNGDCYHYTCSFTLSCSVGYTLNRTTPVTTFCNSNGEWSTPAGYCQARSCSRNLPIMSNGYWMSRDSNGNCYLYSCSYNLSCSEGYTPNRTELVTISCNSNGNWATPAGYCQAKPCNSLPTISNGYWTSQDTSGNCYYYTCSYTLSCSAGYTPSKSDPITAFCSSTGKWSSPEGNCKARSCGSSLPAMQNGYWISNDTSGNCYYYTCSYTFSCSAGYISNVTDTITTSCNFKGKWTTPAANCEVIKCFVPLKRSVNYLIKNETVDFIYQDILAYQCNDGFELSSGNLTRHCQASGDWSGEEPNCTEVRNPEESSSDNAAVLGGSVGGVLVAIVVVVIVAFVLFRRRKRQKLKDDTSYQRNKTYHLHAENLDTIEERVYSNINISYENSFQMDTGDATEYSCVDDRKKSLPDTENKEASNVRPEEYYNISSFDKKSSTVIMLENLTDFVLAGKTTHDAMESEFKKFPSGLVGSHKIALKPTNRNKNRYRRIYAYDDTRVILTDCRGAAETDYINASYIQGFDTVRAYIASQGPTKDMINDFWRMVWQQNSSKIVMLTNLKEDSKVKCLQYWPDTGLHQYGNVTAKIRDTEIYSDFVIRTLEIKQGLSQERVVYQFHFTAWPDKGVPKFSSAIVNFRNKVRYTKIRESGPTIVHCSAGIGRTGTYIALDILTEQGEHLGYVDVATCVRDLRRQRVNMVQTLDQYVFLHSALTEALMLSSSATSAAKFPELYRELLHVDPAKRKRNIEATFDMLKNMSPIADENQYSCAREVKNRKRNRYSNILPVSEFMPPLSSTDGYINAVYLPSYKEKKALILTQMPLKDTKSDFWALVQAQHVRTIVMMNTIAEIERDEVYWPDLGETMSFNNTDIETVEVETIGQHNVVSMKMNDKYLEFDRTVKLIQCGYWTPSQTLPKSPSDILETLDLVQALQQQSGNHPIVVHCMNGVDRSGFFCVMYAVIERLKIEQDVAITQVIEQMRCCRDQIIPSLEQFQFCHEVVLTYIQQFSEYSNFCVQ